MSALGHRGVTCGANRGWLAAPPRSVVLPGVYETSIAAFKQVLRARPHPDNTYAMQIVQQTPQLLSNLMRDPQYPIHPAAFLAVIKDFETGANTYQWGRDDFRCRTPGMCTKKCFYDNDCQRYCKRLAPGAGQQECLQECARSGQVCTDECYGLFQVDPELENLRLGSDVGSPHEYVLWPEAQIPWDFQKVCGGSGLGLIGIEGGPDYCGLLFWLLVSENNQKCTRFAVDSDTYTVDVNGEEVTRYRNPCTDEDYTWTLHNLGQGPAAYQQFQSRQDAWVRKYVGFFKSHQEVVYGYEHCAVNGYLGYNPYDASTNMVPTNVLRAAVHDYGCQIGLVPPWADPSSCGRQP